MPEYVPPTPPISPPPATDAPTGAMYISAVAAAGDRSLRVIYFIVILAILTFTSIKNNYVPGWMTVRAQSQQELYKCLKTNDINSSDCNDLKPRLKESGYYDEKTKNYDIIEFAKSGYWTLAGKFGSAEFPDKNRFIIDQIKKRATLYANKVVDAFTITIPLFGASIDINDLWLISGLMMVFLLYLLRASLEQEYRNILYVKDHKKYFMDLIIMTQILSVLSFKLSPRFRRLEYVIWLTPTFLYVCLLYSDWSTLSAGEVLVGWYGQLYSTLPEFLVVVMVGYFNIRCFRSHEKIRDLIGPILETNPP
ncbi:MAG: hypothetical protein JO328_09645 [Hyphomicrobiales bacterium]|nr:hypothetical protein [Hyphomicrobiales bacterium]